MEVFERPQILRVSFSRVRGFSLVLDCRGIVRGLGAP